VAPFQSNNVGADTKCGKESKAQDFDLKIKEFLGVLVPWW
jgi:hypothetical protein